MTDQTKKFKENYTKIGNEIGNVTTDHTNIKRKRE